MSKSELTFIDEAVSNEKGPIVNGHAVSLVLSTYNGDKYITEQLDSLRTQNRPIDEVLICDDGSTDNTSKIIVDYINRYQLNSWRLTLNKQNKGWKRNFHDLLYCAAGEFIFLCDQDDVWERNKVSEMVELMNCHPEIDVLSCDVEPFYEEGSKQVPNVGGGANDGVVSIRQIDDKAVYILRPGCAYCVRRSFLEEIKPYWDETWPHDAVLWELAQVKGTLALYDKRLVRFRRHGGNASARTRMTRMSRIRDIEELASRVCLMRRFGRDKGTLSPSDELLLNELSDWLECRLRFLRARNIRSLIQVIKGRSHYATEKGLYVDFVLSVFRGFCL